jgi:hypothetical protein
LCELAFGVCLPSQVGAFGAAMFTTPQQPPSRTRNLNQMPKSVFASIRVQKGRALASKGQTQFHF